MALVVQNALEVVPKPLAIYDKVHVSELKINLALTDAAETELMLTFFMYRIDENGHKEFKRDEVFRIYIDDVDKYILDKVNTGSMAELTGIQNIKELVKLLIENDGRFGTASLIE